MSTSLIFLVSSIGILCFYILFLTMTARRTLPLMVGMMVAMSSGMMIGLTIGLIGGILYKGDLFLSTLLGASAGIVIGGLTGVVVGVMGLLDGILSGLMGGMMGAMLGEMIDPNYHEVATRSLFVLCIMVLCLLSTILIPKIETNSWLVELPKKPIFILLIVSGMIFTSILSGPVWKEPTSQSHHHKHNGNQEEQSKVKTIELDADEFHYSSEVLEIAQGEKVKVILHNTGEIEHDLEIQAKNVRVYSSSNLHDHHASDLIHLHAQPNQTEEIEFTMLEKGTFTFTCTLPGHEEAGMKGIIKVS
ncbi:plastocyanin/azurin family copper-binding protein [Bacillus pinisoli]|uniref:plastocyanin/azurin family copper-binding protein n=1 Tax=Bacillus pinisoli TaxID=2901866 RepID=UPI001FF4CA3B|nr:plastocyanin/azurin family copper-binding protein [Bacillus pinisoli]